MKIVFSHFEEAQKLWLHPSVSLAPTLFAPQLHEEDCYPVSVRTEQTALGYTESIANHLASIRFHLL